MLAVSVEGYPCITIAAAITKAAANDGLNKACHHRGSKTLSDTNAMRCGIVSRAFTFFLRRPRPWFVPR